MSASSGLGSDATTGTAGTNKTNLDQMGTDQSVGKSHATGDSIVPEPIQKAAPKGLEKVLPDAVHDTSGVTGPK